MKLQIPLSEPEVQALVAQLGASAQAARLLSDTLISKYNTAARELEDLQSEEAHWAMEEAPPGKGNPEKDEDEEKSDGRDDNLPDNDVKTEVISDDQ
jgi:hypothetical protein